MHGLLWFEEVVMAVEGGRFQAGLPVEKFCLEIAHWERMKDESCFVLTKKKCKSPDDED